MYPGRKYLLYLPIYFGFFFLDHENIQDPASMVSLYLFYTTLAYRATDTRLKNASEAHFSTSSDKKHQLIIFALV